MRVLLVEDDRMIGDSLRNVLRQSGYAVDCVRDGRAAVDVVALASSRAVDLELDAPQPVMERGDPAALRMLARNLIDNAVRFAGNPGRVHVQVVAEANDTVLRVDDSGPGLPPAERTRVFDRFYRRDSGDATGSGLGLAIVRAIAERHGGRIDLGDAPLGGLRAEARLPGAATTACLTGP